MTRAFACYISFGAISAATRSASHTFCSFELVLSRTGRLRECRSATQGFKKAPVKKILLTATVKARQSLQGMRKITLPEVAKTATRVRGQDRIRRVEFEWRVDVQAKFDQSLRRMRVPQTLRQTITWRATADHLGPKHALINLSGFKSAICDRASE